MTASPPAILFIQVERTYSDGNRETELLCTRFDVLEAVDTVEHLASLSWRFPDPGEPSHDVKILNVSSVPDPDPEDADYFNALTDRVFSLEAELFGRGVDNVLNWYRGWDGYEHVADEMETMFRKYYPDYMARRDAKK